MRLLGEHSLTEAGLTQRSSSALLDTWRADGPPRERAREMDSLEVREICINDVVGAPDESGHTREVSYDRFAVIDEAGEEVDVIVVESAEDAQPYIDAMQAHGWRIIDAHATPWRVTRDR